MLPLGSSFPDFGGALGAPLNDARRASLPRLTLCKMVAARARPESWGMGTPLAELLASPG